MEFKNGKKLFLIFWLKDQMIDFQLRCSERKTFNGLGSSHFRFSSLLYKISALKTLLYRAYHILTNYINLHNKLEYLKHFFVKNRYPSEIFHKITNEFLSKIYNGESKQNFGVPKLTLIF